MKKVFGNSSFANWCLYEWWSNSKFLNILDYRLGIKYPKIEVQIEIQFEVTVLPIEVSQNFVQVKEKNINFFFVNLDKVRQKKFGKLRLK